MKKDKLALKTEIQKDFNNETVKNINIAIKISKIMRLLYSESTIFVGSIIPFLGTIIYLYFNNTSTTGAWVYSTATLMVLHFITYKLLYKRVLFKDSADVYDEFDYTIEVLNEIKSTK